jgi:hypothetical protein
MVESVIKVIQTVFLAVMVAQVVVAQEPNNHLVAPQVQETKVDTPHLKVIVVVLVLVLLEILLAAEAVVRVLLEMLHLEALVAMVVMALHLLFLVLL